MCRQYCSSSSCISTGWKEQYAQLVVSVRRLSLKGEIRRVLVGGVVPQGELDSTAINTRVLAVGTSEAGEPGNSSKKLTVDGSRALRGTVSLVEEDGATGATSVGHLSRQKEIDVYD